MLQHFVNENHKSQDSDHEDSSCDEECEDVEIVLLTDEVDEFHIFLTESAKSAVVDTACSRTVAGEIWFNNYLNELNESLMDKVTITQSHVSFRFGDGRKVHSFISARIPIMIANTSCQVQVEIVKENIPLLLSKDSLKKAGTVLDMINDKAIMFGKDVALHFSTNGHYAIDIFQKEKIQKAKIFANKY